MKVAVTAPKGWTTETGKQSGFLMHSFKAPDGGAVVQIMTGPLPEDVSLAAIAERYGAGQRPRGEEAFTLHGFPGKVWSFEGARVLLVPIDDRLYGAYAHGERVESEQRTVDALFRGISVEEPRFFQTYDRPESGFRLKHPVSWSAARSLSQPGKAFFVSFRSPAIAVDEQGSTVHATLEVNVGAVGETETLESYYAKRVKLLEDNFRIVEHARIKEGKAIADLYASETQLASYLEKVVYFVGNGKSYVFKFNVIQPVYRTIEPWIDDIVTTFELTEVNP